MQIDVLVDVKEVARDPAQDLAKAIVGKTKKEPFIWFLFLVEAEYECR